MAMQEFMGLGPTVKPDALLNKIENLMQRVKELKAAIEPFARMSESYPEKGGAHVIASKGGTIIQVSDLRVAHDALTKSSL